MINKRLFSFITAAAIIASFALPLAPAVHADPIAPSTPTVGKEVRVVGKRITGDNKYFEISLEVDRPYEEYTGVGVVLEYDPNYLVPAQNWEDDAPPLDLVAEGNTSWATRRALPTLGLDTWTSHTALAYVSTKDVPDPDNAGQTMQVADKGYLYLGAEFPGYIPDPAPSPDPSATTVPTVPTAPPAPTDTPDPDATPDPDIYVNPIVVARFMYVGADDAAMKATKEDLANKWTVGTGTDAAPVSWDTDWLGSGTDASTAVNTIMHIAPDEISAKSTAGYGAAVYFSEIDTAATGISGQNTNDKFRKKVYRYAYPAVASPTPSPDPAATPAPTGTPVPPGTTFPPYSPPPVGSAITDNEKLQATDIEIVLGEGRSAKSGGLSLSDIFVILFYDWDNSLIGTLTAGIGAPDMAAAVSSYVEERMIHPDLRGQTGATLASLARTDTYRGEYPHTGPNGSNPTVPGGANSIPEELPSGSPNPDAGSKYPLTNKLDYVFAGKTIHDGMPYAGGWTKVTTDTMSKFYTGLTQYDLPINSFGCIDENGVALDATGTPDPTLNVPIYPSYDFDNIKSTDLDGGVLSVKAVYTLGDWLNKGSTLYSMDSEVTTSALTSLTSKNVIFGISFKYRRVNTGGYGVNRAKEPKIKMEFQQKGASGPTTMGVDIKNTEVIDVLLTPSNQVDTITNYQVVDERSPYRDVYNVVSGTTVSEASTSPFQMGGVNGIETAIKFKTLQEDFYAFGTGATTAFNYDFNAMNDYGFMFQNTGGGKAFSTAANVNQAKTFLKKFYAAGKAAGQTDPHTYTYYQIQYAIITKGTGASGYNGQVYVTPAEAESFCKATYPWCT